LTLDSTKPKYAQTVVSMRIVPGGVQFWGGKAVFTQPGPKAGVARAALTYDRTSSSRSFFVLMLLKWYETAP
jgi:hypothetical protein